MKANKLHGMVHLHMTEEEAQILRGIVGCIGYVPDEEMLIKVVHRPWLTDTKIADDKTPFSSVIHKIYGALYDVTKE